MRILVTYAVQGEFTELKFPGLIGEEEVQVGYLRTGVGKVKSAFYLSEAISHAQPDLVVNVGTAGTIRHQVGDIFVCRAKNVPFISVKYVTDIIGQNSVKHWEDKLADARKGLGEFFEKLGGV